MTLLADLMTLAELVVSRVAEAYDGGLRNSILTGFLTLAGLVLTFRGLVFSAMVKDIFSTPEYSTLLLEVCIAEGRPAQQPMRVVKELMFRLDSIAAGAFVVALVAALLVPFHGAAHWSLSLVKCLHLGGVVWVLAATLRHLRAGNDIMRKWVEWRDQDLANKINAQFHAMMRSRVTSEAS